MRSDDEKRILGLWPKYEDGGYVMPGDVAVANNGAKKGRAFTVLSVRVNTVGVCLTDCDGSYWNYKAGDRRVKRPEPKVLDADGVEVKVDDTVWLKDGTELLVEEVNRYGARCFDGEKRMTLDPKFLIHTQPDSWEQLERDATMSPWSYCNKHGLVADRSDGESIPTTECRFYEPKERTCHVEYKCRKGDIWPRAVCSVCGHDLSHYDVADDCGEDAVELCPYCPNCGAKVVAE